MRAIAVLLWKAVLDTIHMLLRVFKAYVCSSIRVLFDQTERKILNTYAFCTRMHFGF